MIRLIITLAFGVAVGTAMKFTDCSTDPSTKAVTLYSLDMQPMPVLFPGELQLYFNLTINTQIDQLFLETVLEKNTLGTWLHLPCIRTTNIGSCHNIDACTILDRILNGSSVVSASLGQQFSDILQAATGHKARCPIPKETVAFINQKLTLQEIPAILSFLTGDYRLKIVLKDDPTVIDNVGCIMFEASIDRGAVVPVG